MAVARTPLGLGLGLGVGFGDLEMKEVMSSFDIAAITFELEQKIIGKHLDNVYQLSEKTFLIKIRPGDLNLIIEIEKRIHLTKYAVKTPQAPTQFCMALRKYLSNGKIIEVGQHEFERIVTFTIQTREGNFKLIAEIFKRGNLILLDPEDRILHSTRYMKMRDRNIIRGERFRHAPSTGVNPLKAKFEDIAKLERIESTETVKALTRILPIGGQYAEEILARASVTKETRTDELSQTQLKAIYSSLVSLVASLAQRRIEPCIILEKDGKPIDITPIPLRLYENFQVKCYPSFNEAADRYFSEYAAEMEKTEMKQKLSKKTEELKRILAMQEKQLKELEQVVERSRKIGDIIYVHLNEIQQLLESVTQRKREGKAWTEIEESIKQEAAEGRTPEAYLYSIDPKTQELIMQIEGVQFSIGIKQRAQDRAAEYYTRAKRAAGKIRGLETSIKEVNEKLKAFEKEVEKTIEKLPTLTKKPERAWYEKFYWFRSSEGYLVLAGRDATTNEQLIKRYTEPHDIVLHADIHGAPFVVIKTEGRTLGEETIKQAAEAAVSRSKAWANGIGSGDAYWVKPEQLSSSAPPGEYLAKGMFMVNGPRNYLRGVELRLAVGVIEKEGQILLVGGPTEAVKSQTSRYVEIVPGKTPASKLSKQILYELAAKAPQRLGEEIRRIELNEVQRFIPAGRGDILRRRRRGFKP